jgi:hypothetical protein
MELAELFPMQDSSPTTENIDPTDPIFHNEEAARPYFETQRWPSGPYCLHRGSFGVTSPPSVFVIETVGWGMNDGSAHRRVAIGELASRLTECIPHLLQRVVG